VKEAALQFLKWDLVRTIPRTTMLAAAIYGLLIVAFAIAERVFYRRSFRRYTEREVINDYIYCVFFNGGWFTLFIYPALKVTERLCAPLKLNLLPRMPLALSIVTFYVVADFSFYWAHRLLHTRFFWPFHSVHHSQEEMTYLTTARFHFVDVAVLTLVTLIPATIIGWPARTVAAVGFILNMQDKMQHAALEWTFGPLYRVVVSPRYHRIHHSAERQLQGRNYSRVMPLWDSLFGTAHDTAERPERVGVDGLAMPHNVLQQFVYPFRMLFGSAPRTPAAESVRPAEA
jgi:sterol desaturase/sphingolipid hydroxylase (fatty acid hydroxylase superfamily)